MGTAGELPKEPVQKTLFEEDMTEEQLAEAVIYIIIHIFNYETEYKIIINLSII